MKTKGSSTKKLASVIEEKETEYVTSFLPSATRHRHDNFVFVNIMTHLLMLWTFVSWRVVNGQATYEMTTITPVEAFCNVFETCRSLLIIIYEL